MMNPTLRLLIPVLVGLAAAPAVAGDLAASSQPDERIQSLLVYGSDPCPKSDDGSIVVCARRPESERYRIPKKLRDPAPPPGAPGWGSTVQNMEQVQRQSLPNSCSTIGSGGQTGCALAALHQWYLERQLDGRAPDAR